MIKPRPATRRARLSAEEERLLRDYREREERLAREAQPAPAAPAREYETRPRVRHATGPINEKLLPASDGPPPAHFRAEEPAVPEGPARSEWTRQIEGRRDRRPPSGVNLAPAKRVRVAG